MSMKEEQGRGKRKEGEEWKREKGVEGRSVGEKGKGRGRGGKIEKEKRRAGERKSGKAYNVCATEYRRRRGRTYGGLLTWR